MKNLISPFAKVARSPFSLVRLLFLGTLVLQLNACSTGCDLDFGLRYNEYREQRGIPVLEEQWLSTGETVCRSTKIYNPSSLRPHVSHDWKFIRIVDGKWEQEIDSYSKVNRFGIRDSMQVLADQWEVLYRHYKPSPASNAYISKDSADRWLGN